MRVSIESFSTQAEAYRSLQVIREQKAYQNAWVLKVLKNIIFEELINNHQA